MTLIVQRPPQNYKKRISEEAIIAIGAFPRNVLVLGRADNAIFFRYTLGYALSRQFTDHPLACYHSSDCPLPVLTCRYQ